MEVSFSIQMWSWLISTLFLIVQESEQYEGRVVCYYRADNIYREEGFRMQPHEIDPDLCTHIIYYTAYLHPEEAITASNPVVDINKGGYKKMVKLKENNPNLKVMLSLSSDPAGRDLWPLIAPRKSTRHWFTVLVVDFLRAHRFDGLDIDWQIHNSKKDSNNYLHLLQDIRAQMEVDARQYNLPRLELSVLLPAQIQQLHRHFQLANVTKYVDFINVATMDYWSLNPYTVQHHSPLYRNITEGSLSILNVDESIKYYLFKCVPPEKLVLGIPTYGRSFRLTDGRSFNLGSSCKYPGEKGFASASPGTLAYFEICTYFIEEGWDVENSNLTSMGPYAHYHDRWVGFDDVGIISLKAKYARDKKLGGLMFWTIDQDDFRGYCQYKNALVRAGKFTLNTGVRVWDAPMLDEEEKRYAPKSTGYIYPKPTVQQPVTPWTLPTTTRAYSTLVTTVRPTTTTIKPTTTSTTTKKVTTEKPSTPVTKPTLRTTTEIIEIVNGGKRSTTFIPQRTSSFTTAPTQPSKITTAVPKPNMFSTSQPPSKTEGKNRINTVSTPDVFKTTLSVPLTTKDTTKLPSFTTQYPPGKELNNDIIPNKEPENFQPIPTKAFDTASVLSSNNEVDSGSDEGEHNSLVQLRRVLETLNQVLSGVSEISSPPNQPQSNLTIDTSFINLLQPLFNLRNNIEVSMVNNDSSKLKNTTVKVQSDLKKYKMRSSRLGSLKSSDEETTLPQKANDNPSPNSSDVFTIIPGEDSDKRYLLRGGRDIININLNVSINNHYYGVDQR